jgi:hypothetical protein
MGVGGEWGDLEREFGAVRVVKELRGLKPRIICFLRGA